MTLLITQSIISATFLQTSAPLYDIPIKREGCISSEET